MLDNKNVYEDFKNSVAWRTVEKYCVEQIQIKGNEILSLIKDHDSADVKALVVAKGKSEYIRALEDVLLIADSVKKQNK